MSRCTLYIYNIIEERTLIKRSLRAFSSRTFNSLASVSPFCTSREYVFDADAVKFSEPKEVGEKVKENQGQSRRTACGEKNRTEVL